MRSKAMQAFGQAIAQRALVPFLAFPLGILMLELLLKFWDFGTIFNRGFLYITLFSIASGVALAALSTMGSFKINRIISLLSMGAVTLLCGVQAVYFMVIKTVFSVYSVSAVASATEFWKVGVTGFIRSIPILIPMLLPFMLVCIYGKRFTPDHKFSWRRTAALLLVALLLHAVTLATIFGSRSGIASPWQLYHNGGNPDLTMSNFGAISSLRLDLRRILLPNLQPAMAIPEQNPDPLVDKSAQTEQYQPNVLPIDFAALEAGEGEGELRDMHAYFGAQSPTLQNAFTGRFEGKNLIMITAEAFSSWALDPEITPTLYRLAGEGFVFKNFYTPLWWVSTSDGEYFSCTGLTPKAGKQSFSISADNFLPFCMGNQLRAQGYQTNAYHNHTYTYYGRDKTHPNMGYDYQGIGNGLEVKEIWPASDVDMMASSIADYMSNPPFHVYYMTVSGHLEYDFSVNKIAEKNRDKVSHLPLSEESRAYLACQIELDRAVAYLIAQLEASGQLENTVIALYPDHYPYGLSTKALGELMGSELTQTPDRYRSSMILWSGDMEEPIVVEKPCSNLDIVPTLSNLFALPFDSRLMAGRDIFSSEAGLVIFSDTSYITAQGSYDAKSDVFTPADGEEVDEDYPRKMLRIVQDRFLYSGKVLLHDYYAHLGLKAPFMQKEAEVPAE